MLRYASSDDRKAPSPINISLSTLGNCAEDVYNLLVTVCYACLEPAFIHLLCRPMPLRGIGLLWVSGYVSLCMMYVTIHKPLARQLSFGDASSISYL